MTDKPFTQIKLFKNLKALPDGVQKASIGPEDIFALGKTVEKTGTNTSTEYWLFTETGLKKNEGKINTSAATSTKIGAPTQVQKLLDDAIWMAVFKSGSDYKFYYQDKNSAPLAVKELIVSNTPNVQPTTETKTVFGANLGTVEFESTGFNIQPFVGLNQFRIHEVRIDLFENDDPSSEKILVGHFISDEAASPESPISWEHGFFVDSSISKQKLLEKNISAISVGSKLLLLWKEDISLQRSNYLEIDRGTPPDTADTTHSSMIKSLALSDMLPLETIYSIDINQDTSIGSVKLVTGVPNLAAPTFDILMPGTAANTTTSRGIYRLTNGDLLERNLFKYSKQSSDITVTTPTNHGLKLGDDVYIDAPGTIDDKLYKITKVSAPLTSSPSSPWSFSFNAPSFTPPAKEMLFFAKADNVYSLDQIRLLFKTVSESDIIALETRQINANKIDLNDDGVFGACNLELLIKNENFGIYRTTLGNVVYSEASDLSPGDSIPSPVLIPLVDYPKWNNLLSLSEGLIATISRSSSANQLILGFIEKNPLTNVTRLQEALFDFKVTLNLPTISAPTNSTLRERSFTFDDSQPNRISFLQREDAYGIDLNGDGVIGNSIVKEISSSPSGAIFELASGEIYFSKNTQLNVAERIGQSDSKLFLLDNTPEKIFAFELLPSELNLIYSSAGRYFTERFTFTSTGLIPALNTRIELSFLDLTQSEIKFAVDINNDDVIGDRIASVAYGHNGGDGIAGPKPTSQNLGIYSLQNKTAFNQDAYIISNDPSLKVDSVQPSQNMRALKKTVGGMDPYWSIPSVNGKIGKIVAVGMVDDPTQSIRIVLEDTSKGNNYFLVTFDDNGMTNKPRGNSLNGISLYNEEIRLNTDIDRDNFIGDSATKLASNDNFAIYQLNASGRVILRGDNGWEVNSNPAINTIRQTSLDFVSLQQLNGSVWLPAGYSQKPTDTGYTLITSESELSSISQVAFNADGSVNVYMKRLVETGNSKREVLYNVEFNAKGLTKNPLGKSLTQAEIFSQETKKELDINGDGFIGKPFLGMEVTVSASLVSTPLASGLLMVRENGDSTASLIMKSVTNNKFSVIQESKSFQAGKAPAWLNWLIAEQGGPDFFNQGSLSPEQLVLYSNVTKQNYLVFRNKDNGFSVADSAGTIVFQNTNFQWARPIDQADFNGDGKQDILMLSRDDNSVVVFSGNDRGGFKPLQKFVSPISVRHASDANWGLDVQSARITNDKFADAIVFQRAVGHNGASFSTNDKDQIAIYRNSKGNLVLSEILQLEMGGDVRDVTANDLNNDGLADLILTKNQSNAIEILFNANGKYKNNGEFINSLTLSGIYLPKKTLTADINCDDKKDIIVLAENEQSSTSIFAYFGKGDGEFLSAQEIFSQDDLQMSRLGVQSDIPRILDFFTADPNGDGFVDVVINSTYHNSILWNMTEVAFGRAKFSGVAGSRLEGDNRSDVINYGQFVEDAVALGLNPSLKPSAQQKNLFLGYAEYYPSGPLTSGNHYSVQIDASTPTQVNISSGRSSITDISLSLNHSVSLEYTSSMPVMLRPGVQNESVGWPMANADTGSFSFVVDNTITGNNFIFNFRDGDDTVEYVRQPSAVGSFSIYGSPAQKSFVSNFFGLGSTTPTVHGLHLHSYDGSFPETLHKLPSNSGNERVVINDSTILHFFNGSCITLDDYNFDINLSLVDFHGVSKHFFFSNFDAGDTLKLPSGYALNIRQHMSGQYGPETLFELSVDDVTTPVMVSLVGVASVKLVDAVYVVAE
jgi:hypothetical protein